MSIAFVRQTTGAIDTSITTVVSLSAAAAANNTLVACCTLQNAAAPVISSITTTGVTWTHIGQRAVGASGVQVEVWLGVVGGATSGTTLTFALVSGTATLAVNISEFSGLTASPVDAASVSSVGVSANPAAGAYTTIAANTVVIAFAGIAGPDNPTATPSGYTALTYVDNGGTANGTTAAYKIVSAAGAQSASWTIPTSDTWGTIIVALKQNNIVSSFGHGVGVSAAKALAVVNRSGQGHGVGLSASKAVSTIIITGAARGIGLATSKGTLVKYYGAMRGIGLSASKCSGSLILSGSAHGLGVSASAGRLVGSILIGKGHGVGVSVSKNVFRKLFLPPPSASAIRVGPWISNKPSG